MCPSPSEPTVITAISAPTTESRYEYPSDDDVEIDDSIADEDYVPPSNSSDSSSDEESCEIPLSPCRFTPRRLQIRVQSPTVSRSDPHSDPVQLVEAQIQML